MKKIILAVLTFALAMVIFPEIAFAAEQGNIYHFIYDEADGPFEQVILENGVDVYDSEKSNKSLSIIDTLSTDQDEAGLIIDKITIQRLIEDLDSRDKELILLRFYKNKTQTEVAKILGISQVQVSRIEKKILNGMKTELVS